MADGVETQLDLILFKNAVHSRTYIGKGFHCYSVHVVHYGEIYNDNFHRGLPSLGKSLQN